MNEAENTEGDLSGTVIEPIDVRAELKKNLAEEFTSALSAQETLTDVQRAALIESVKTEQVTATSILQILNEAED